MKHLILVLLFVAGGTVFAAEKTTVNVQVTDKGFEPAEIKVKPGTHVVLKVTRKTESTCATEVVVKEKSIKTDLPLNKEISIDVGIVKKGETKFSCAMEMITGHIVAQ